MQSIHGGYHQEVEAPPYSSYKREPAKSRTPRVSKPKAKRAPKTFGKRKR